MHIYKRRAIVRIKRLWMPNRQIILSLMRFAKAAALAHLEDVASTYLVYHSLQLGFICVLEIVDWWDRINQKVDVWNDRAWTNCIVQLSHLVSMLDIFELRKLHQLLYWVATQISQLFKEFGASLMLTPHPCNNFFTNYCQFVISSPERHLRDAW